MKKTITLALLILAACVHIALAEEEGEEEIYQFPDLKPEVSLWGGFTLYDHDGSKQAGEYEYLENSLSGGGTVRAFPFPHRISVEGEFINKNDFYGEGRYAYKDIVVSRWISRRVFHNLRNIGLIDFDPSTPSPGVDIRDEGVDFDVKTDINQLSLRLKAPDFPFHLYTEGFFVDREGKAQQRFLAGSGYFNNLERVSAKRDTDGESRVYTVGMNTHLGPVELDIQHSDMSFDPGGDEALAQSYTSAGFPPGSLRGAGIFEHNRVSELSGSSNTLKLHTDYTGRVFASATLSRIDRKNEFSRAKVDYDLAHGEFLWIPLTKLRVSAKYRYEKTDTNSPDSATFPDLSGSSNDVRLNNIRSAIPSEVNIATGTVRYGPYKGVAVKAEYRHERKERDKSIAEEWYLSKLIERDIISLSASARVLRKLKVNAKYTYKDISEDATVAALGIEPTSSNEGQVSLSWTPTPKVSTHLLYAASKKEKDNVQFLDSTGAVVDSANDRDALSQRFHGTITFLLNENLFLSPSYTYLRNEIDQDLLYSAWPPIDSIVDNSVESTDKAHNYSVNLTYTPIPNLELTSLLSYTKSEGHFRPRAFDAVEPVSIASFSELEIEELTLKSQLTYEFKEKWGVGLGYRYTDYDDDSSDNAEDGSYHAMQVRISKRW